MIGTIVDYIILIGSVCAAAYKIWSFFAKPTSKLKNFLQQKEANRVKAILDEELPVRFLEHDLDIRDKYKADRQNYLLEIKNEVLCAVGGNIAQNSADLEALKISARDVLREKIMGIYHKGRHTRSMNEYDREALTQYYKDYKALNGNSYIDRRYERMKRWETIYDDSLEDDE